MGEKTGGFVWLSLSLSLGLGLGLTSCGQQPQSRQALNQTNNRSAIQSNSIGGRTQASNAASTTTALKSATLSGGPAGARVNIRAQPDLNAQILDQGIIGEQIGVEQGQKNTDGSLWYRVKLYATGSVGWVYGTLVEFPGARRTQPASTALPLGVAFEKCRLQTRRELGKDVTPTLALDAPRSEGGYQITWSTSSGATGNCTVDKSGKVIGFVNRPTSPAVPTVVLDKCRDRVAEAFSGITRSEIDLYASKNNGDGTSTVNWRTRSGAVGTCVADNQGTVKTFDIQTGNPGISSAALNSCQNRAVGEFNTNRADIVVLGSNPSENNRYTVRLRSQSTNRTAVCVVDNAGAIASFAILGTEGTAETLQDFNQIPDVGRFKVVQGNYRDVANLREFTALVNDQRQTWWTDCKTGQLGTGSQTIPRTDVTGRISSFVCAGRS